MLTAIVSSSARELSFASGLKVAAPALLISAVIAGSLEIRASTRARSFASARLATKVSTLTFAFCFTALATASSAFCLAADKEEVVSPFGQSGGVKGADAARGPGHDRGSFWI